ncbi:fructosamine kinase family protein [Nocardia mangyaensis]|uniref:fructosamine kinase family protein n=1 Tax=Nocardia mangyaensis TaxID=2213200 RepID=UPI002675F1B3|nr:fructosamine kinase family protein [Nocardia mangyaensis]MDO3647155.1 fructosamine kinase family protein [Nocardia mangyaensis]
MDLPFLRANPHLLPTFLAHQRLRTTPVSGGSISVAERIGLDDGTQLFLKTWPGGLSAAPTTEVAAAPPGLFAAEADGLRWLRSAGGVAVPEVYAVTEDLLLMEWVEHAEPTRAAAERFGRELAATHRAGAPHFGATRPLSTAVSSASVVLPTQAVSSVSDMSSGHAVSSGHAMSPSQGEPPSEGEPPSQGELLTATTPQGSGPPAAGFLAGLPLDNTPGDDWPTWYRARRILPYLRLAVDAGALDPADAALVESIHIEAPAEPPARIHGDLWPGNIVWGWADTPYLIDPAAHGGHRETDLATLTLFGAAPHFSRIIAAYSEIHSLAPDWESRIPLHTLPLLLVHAVLFGRGYRNAVLAAAGRYR